MTACVTLLLSFAGMACWAARNPFAVHWDNAIYLNDCRRDLNALMARGLKGLGGSFLHTNPWRPPAYRLLALAATPLFGAQINVLRAVSLLAWAVALWFLYRGVRSVAGPAAGVLAVMLLAASPSIMDAVRVFGSESALYLSVAVTFSLLLRAIAGSSLSRGAWIGLGVALGLGFLSKLSFPWIVAGPLVWCLVLAWRGRLPGFTVMDLVRASILGLAIAIPWYSVNIVTVLDMALVSKSAARYSLGDPSFAVLLSWLGVIAREGLGSKAVLGSTMLVLTAVISAAAVRARPAPGVTAALVACALGAVPFAAGQFLASSNHDVRILSPAFIPLLCGAAITVGNAPWLQGAPVAVATALLLLWQTSEYLPVAGSRQDYWDWTPLYRLTASKGLVAPRIAYIGASPQYNVATMSGPWVERDEEVSVEWLWNADSGPIRWPRVLGAAAKADVVVVPPTFKGDPYSPIPMEAKDNAHNAALTRHLSHDPDLEPPQPLLMGKKAPVVLFAFFRADRVH